MIALIKVLLPEFGSPMTATLMIFSCAFSISLLDACVERNRGLIIAQNNKLRLNFSMIFGRTLLL